MREMVSEFQRIHDTFRPKIHRYLTRLVGAGEAEDLTQEVFFKVSQAMNTFRGEAATVHVALSHRDQCRDR
jgi:RNA polymerase sigma-70 factor (ECF subfamily)